MITNAFITLYHKTKGRNESWQKTTYANVWVFGGHGVSLNKGLTEANDLQVRIPYSKNEITIADIQVGDLIKIGEGQDITTASDLKDYYTITSINNNTFGSEPHVHIGAK
jgi:hypothetical protein